MLFWKIDDFSSLVKSFIRAKFSSARLALALEIFENFEGQSKTGTLRLGTHPIYTFWYTIGVYLGPGVKLPPRGSLIVARFYTCYKVTFLGIA